MAIIDKNDNIDRQRSTQRLSRDGRNRLTRRLPRRTIAGRNR